MESRMATRPQEEDAAEAAVVAAAAARERIEAAWTSIQKVLNCQTYIVSLLTRGTLCFFFKMPHGFIFVGMRCIPRKKKTT